jgi:ABC-type antimicrobial peptide transport system permease subunit
MRNDGLVINKEASVFRDEIYSKWTPNPTYIMLKNNVSEKKFKETLSNRRFNFTLHAERLGMIIKEDGSLVMNTANEEDERFTISPLNDPFQYETALTLYLEKFLIGLLILLTTLFNYTSFQTSQFYNRLRECALRRTAGAGKKDLFFLFFTEIIIAFVMVYFVSVLLLYSFKGFIVEQIWIVLPNININIIPINMLKYLLFVLLIASVLYLIPINIIHRMSIRTVFLGISQKGKKGTVRNLMLFFQLVVLLLFISASAIVGLQTNKCKSLLFNHLSKEDRKNIVSTFFDGELMKNKDAIISEITSSPLVNKVLLSEMVASSSGQQWITDNDGWLDIPNYGGKEIGFQAVHPDFFDFFQCKLIAGKFFTKDSPHTDVVIDDNFASYYKDKSPIGESFGRYRIVGVVKSLNTYKERWENFHSEKFPVFYSINRDNGDRKLYIKFQKGKSNEVRQLVEEILKKFSPPQNRHTVFLYSFDKELEWNLDEENRLFRSMQILFAISLVICLLGIYSAIVMNTEKRRKEIAIRKINGATVKDIVVLFGKTYVILWTTACVLFSPVVYYFGDKWIEKYNDRISLNAGLFIGIYAVIMTLVILTIIFQILKTARCNPAEVIKKE